MTLSKFIDYVAEDSLRFYEEKCLKIPSEFLIRDRSISSDEEYKFQSKLPSAYLSLQIAMLGSGVGFFGAGIYYGVSALSDVLSGAENGLSNFDLCVNMALPLFNEAMAFLLSRVSLKVGLQSFAREKTLSDKLERYKEGHQSL